jgi:hypothetical protein
MDQRWHDQRGFFLWIQSQREETEQVLYDVNIAICVHVAILATLRWRSVVWVIIA